MNKLFRLVCKDKKLDSDPDVKRWMRECEHRLSAKLKSDDILDRFVKLVTLGRSD